MTEEKEEKTTAAVDEKAPQQTEEKPKKAPMQKPALSPEWTLFSR